MKRFVFSKGKLMETTNLQLLFLNQSCWKEFPLVLKITCKVKILWKLLRMIGCGKYLKMTIWAKLKPWTMLKLNNPVLWLPRKRFYINANTVIGPMTTKMICSTISVIAETNQRNSITPYRKNLNVSFVIKVNHLSKTVKV